MTIARGPGIHPFVSPQDPCMQKGPHHVVEAVGFQISVIQTPDTVTRNWGGGEQKQSQSRCVFVQPHAAISPDPSPRAEDEYLSALPRWGCACPCTWHRNRFCKFPTPTTPQHGRRVRGWSVNMLSGGALVGVPKPTIRWVRQHHTMANSFLKEYQT